MNKRQKREKQIYSIKTIEKAFEVLKVLSGGDGLWSLSAISEKLDMQKNSVFRLLATLEHLGYATQDDRELSYRLGPGVLELGRAYVRNMPLMQIARPYLEELSLECNETVYLGRVSQGRVGYLDVVQSTHPVRVASRVGDWLPVLDTAVGRVHIAFGGLAEISDLPLLGSDDEAPGSETKSMATMISTIRENGYALEDQDYEEGVRSIAVPIMNDLDEVVAALSVSGPVFRMEDERLESLIIPALKDAGSRLSKEIGAVDQVAAA